MPARSQRTLRIGQIGLGAGFLYLPSDRVGEEVALVADDQVILRRDGDEVLASCPKPLDGKIEVRGCGIAHLQTAAKEATLKLIVDLDWTGERPRLPETTEWESSVGYSCPAHRPRPV